MFINTFLMALREIRRNLLRSGLTVLGVVIGVAAVIIIVTLGAGTTQQVGSEISKMGSNMLTLMPGGDMRMGPGQSAPPFSMADVDALRREVVGLAAIAPYSQRMESVVVGNENRRVSIVGTTGDITVVRNWQLTEGRVFQGAEERSGASVCVIGARIRNEMLANQPALGAQLRVGKISCEVIGVLEPKGQSMFGGDQDLVVALPIRTYQRRITGSDKIAQVFMSGEAPELLDDVKSQVKTIMRERRHLAADAQADFNVTDMTEISNVMQSTIGVLTTFLSAIAGVSLLVGGIGIMNIMLVSVTERTREIGIRLAIGATQKEVMLQFLMEAGLLSAMGGLTGILLGLLGAASAAPFMNIKFTFEPGIAFLAFTFSGIIGIAFGFMPARRAARLNPIEALRHE